MCIDIVEKLFFFFLEEGLGGFANGHISSIFTELSARHRVVAEYFRSMLLLFQRKYNGISCDSSAKQTIHMKCLVLFSLTVVWCAVVVLSYLRATI